MPFIAETGGLNGMFVDTTALREQVIDDVVASAFGSAGQRCSALRILFVPDETADGLIEGSAGRWTRWCVGDPADPATDIGPVIDADGQGGAGDARGAAGAGGEGVHRLAAPAGGDFFGPVLAEIPSADFLEREVFGPVLHVVRYDAGDLAAVAGAWPRSGYGLTLGVHSRIESFAAGGPRAGPGRQRLRQPLDHRRGGRRAALRRRGPVRHRPQGRRRPTRSSATPSSARSASISTAQGGDPSLVEPDA